MGGSANVSINRIGDSISEMELTECDRMKLHLLGNIQGDAGNVLFFSFPEGKIQALDTKIRDDVPWFKYRGHLDDLPSTQSVATTTTMSVADGDEMDTGDTVVVAAAAAPSADAAWSVSARAEEMQSLSADVLGSSLVSWIPYSLYKEIHEAIEEMKRGRSQRAFHFFSYKKHSYAISLSTTTLDVSVIGMEIEQIDETEAAAGFYDTLVSLGRVMDMHADEKIVTSACDTVFRLLGAYDRGMVYKFHDDLSGEIIHEIKKPDSDIQSSYLGLRFPAGDIPLTARKLYIKNGLRYIRNVDGGEVQVIDHVGGDIDLTHCRMRACAKCHLLYMKNMGVKCSMSIAIVVEDQLWGLLAFHGYTKPFKPSLHQRIACETVSRRYSLGRIESSIVFHLSYQLVAFLHADQLHDVRKGRGDAKEGPE